MDTVRMWRWRDVCVGSGGARTGVSMLGIRNTVSGGAGARGGRGVASFQIVRDRSLARLATGVPPVLAEALPGREVAVAGGARVRAQPSARPGGQALLRLGVCAGAFLGKRDGLRRESTP